MKRLITMTAMVLIGLAITRSASALPAPCICNHMPCPCAAVDGPVCRMTPRICPILIDPMQLIERPSA